MKDDKSSQLIRSTKEEHAGGTISLIGGKVDNDRNVTGVLEESLKREIFEEVGIQINENMHYVYNSSFVSDNGQAVVNIVFLCEYKSGEAHAKSADEVESVFWLTNEEVMNYPKMPPWTKESLMRSAKLLDQSEENA